MFLKSVIDSALLPAMLEFLLCVINDVEALLKIFQEERLLAVFLYNKLKKIFIIMKRFVH